MRFLQMQRLSLLRFFFVFAIVFAANAVSNAQYDLYVGQGGGRIVRVDLENPSNVQQVAPASLVNTGNGIALDYIERKVYWAADAQFGAIDKIRRSNLDGSTTELFTLPPGQPADLVVDPFARKLYFPERITNSINVINLDGTGFHSIISTHEPRGMDIDFLHGQLYWVEFESNRIRRANLDGSNITDVITTGINRPFDVTIDPINGRLYWVELGADTNNEHGKVWTANLNGTNPILIAADQYQPQELVVDLSRSSIYWNNDRGNALMRANLDGSSPSTLSVSGFSFTSFVLDAPPLIPEPSSIALLVCGASLLTWKLRRKK